MTGPVLDITDPEDVVLVSAPDAGSDPVLDALQRDGASLVDPRLIEGLLGQVRAGVPIPAAAENCGIDSALAIRMIMRHPEGRAAMKTGAEVRVHQVEGEVQGAVGDALSVIQEVMNNGNEEGRVRLAAATKMIEYSGMLQSQRGRPGVSVEIASRGSDFAARFRTVSID